MNLIDRYVQEVARRLPGGQREEAARELRSNDSALMLFAVVVDPRLRAR
jgi:hypothetical protein